MELRLAKIALVASLAAYALLVAYGNVVDYPSNYAFVRHVLSMDTTFPDTVLRSRAITDERLWHGAYLLIILTEAAIGLLLAWATVLMLARLGAPAASFERAKRLAYLGGALGVLLWFFGFMVVAGEYFAMWQSKDWNGQDAAVRIYLAFIGMLILLAVPERELS